MADLYDSDLARRASLAASPVPPQPAEYDPFAHFDELSAKVDADRAAGKLTEPTGVFDLSQFQQPSGEDLRSGVTGALQYVGEAIPYAGRKAVGEFARGLHGGDAADVVNRDQGVLDSMIGWSDKAQAPDKSKYDQNSSLVTATQDAMESAGGSLANLPYQAAGAIVGAKGGAALGTLAGPAGTGVGGLAGGFLGATAGAAVPMKRAEEMRYMEDMRDRLIADAAAQGRTLTNDELVAKMSDPRLRELASTSGLAEAGFESLDEPFKFAAAGFGGKALAKALPGPWNLPALFAGSLMTSLAGETATDMVQRPAYEEGARILGLSSAPGEGQAYADKPITEQAWQSFKEVAPATLVLESLMGLTFGATGKVRDYLGKREQKSNTNDWMNTVKEAVDTGDIRNLPDDGFAKVYDHNLSVLNEAEKSGIARPEYLDATMALDQELKRRQGIVTQPEVFAPDSVAEQAAAPDPVRETLTAAGLADKPEWQQAMATVEALTGGQRSVEAAMGQGTVQQQEQGVPGQTLAPSVDAAAWNEVDARYQQRIADARSRAEADRAAAQAQAEANRVASAAPFPSSVEGMNGMEQPAPVAPEEAPAPKVLTRQEQKQADGLAKRIDNLTKLLRVEKNIPARVKIEENLRRLSFDLNDLTETNAPILTPDEQARSLMVSNGLNPQALPLPAGGENFSRVGEPYAGTQAENAAIEAAGVPAYDENALTESMPPEDRANMDAGNLKSEADLIRDYQAQALADADARGNELLKHVRGRLDAQSVANHFGSSVLEDLRGRLGPGAFRKEGNGGVSWDVLEAEAKSQGLLSQDASLVDALQNVLPAKRKTQEQASRGIINGQMEVGGYSAIMGDARQEPVALPSDRMGIPEAEGLAPVNSDGSPAGDGTRYAIPSSLPAPAKAEVNDTVRRIDNLNKMLSIEKNQAARLRITQTILGYEQQLNDKFGVTPAQASQTAAPGAFPANMARPVGQTQNTLQTGANEVAAPATSLGVSPQAQQEQMRPATGPAVDTPAPAEGWRGHSVEDVKKAFPKSTVSETDTGHRVDLPNGRVLYIDRAGSIAIDRAAARAGGYTDEQIDRANAAGGAPGVFNMVNGTGVIQLTEAGKGELGHELMHFARVVALTPKQNAALNNIYGKQAKDADHLEEVIAQAYNTWLAKRGPDRSGLFAIIRRFFQNIRQAIAPTAEGVFEKVASGQAWGQKSKQGAALPLYSLADTAGAAPNEVEEARRLWAEMGTESPYFKEWFSGSKVVDGDGKPLVVYHGTGKSGFSVFMRGQGGYMYFTPDPEYANRYAGNGGGVYSGFLSMKNPLDLTYFGGSDVGGVRLKDYLKEQLGLDMTGIDFNPGSRPLYNQIKHPEFKWRLQDLGFDGIKQIEDGAVAYLAFEPEQFKSATGNRGTFDAKNPDIRYSLGFADTAAPTFYSQMQRTLEKPGMLPKATSARSMLAAIQKHVGKFKGVELDESGLKGWLEAAEDKLVTRQDVMDELAARQIQIEEVTKGKNPAGYDDADAAGLAKAETLADNYEEVSKYTDLSRADFDEMSHADRVDWLSSSPKFQDAIQEELTGGGVTKYEGYQTPGGENYRELLLTLPSDASRGLTAKEKSEYYGLEAFVDGGEATQQQIDRFNELGKRMDSDPSYRSPHWDEPNVLAHVRYNDRTGPNGEKILHVEEVQSDWHQEGKKKGYDSPIWGIFDKDGILDATKPTEKEAREFARENGYPEGAVRQTDMRHGVPNAPFKNTSSWAMLAMKRMIRHAAENGYDRITWTPGEVQAERYDLRKQVDQIRYKANGDGTYDVWASDREGRALNNTVDKQGLKPDQIEDFVGKEVAQKIVDGKGRDEDGDMVLEGVDLKVGGEGMKGFYDQILPKEVARYIKQYGGKVETSEISKDSTRRSLAYFLDWAAEKGDTRSRPELAEAWSKGFDDPTVSAFMRDKVAQPVWSFTLTDKMREAAMTGQPLYSLGFSDPAIEAEYQEGRKGIGDQRSFFARSKEWFAEQIQGFSRHFIHLPNQPRFAPAIETLRQLEAAPTAAQEQAIRNLKKITAALDPEKFDLFSRKVLLDDLAHEAALGHDLPFGFTPAAVASEKAILDRAAAASPEVTQALATRKALQDDLAQRLVDAGILSQEQLKNPAYFRHEVLKYAREWQNAQGTGSSLKKPKPGYAKGREGSTEAINANYLEVEYGYMQRALTDLATIKAIEKLKAQYDIRPDLEKAAKEANNRALTAMGVSPKGMTEAEKRKTLGDKYKRWMDLVPEGYDTFQVDKGLLYAKGNMLTDRAMGAVTEAAFMDPQAFQDQAPEIVLEILDGMRQGMQVIGKKPEIVLPKELTATLNDLRPKNKDGFFDKALAKPLGMWKQWMLINPRRVLKYNLNNMSGDIDAVVAGNWKALKKMPEAFRELRQVMLREGDPTQEYLDAVKRGVFDSGLSVQEIPDIASLNAFANLQAKSLGKLNLLGKGWGALQKYTQFRENILRYAAYKDYLSRLEAGESMDSIGYGAAHKPMVDALTDNKDKAALLARSLVGDYGAVSHYGQGLRNKVIPFYSWMEVNAKRYNRLIMNAFDQGIVQGVKTGGLTAAMIGARTTAYLGIRMFALQTLINLYNRIFHGDDEDKLGELERNQLHVILGHDKDGNIHTLRLQGAMSDYLGWIGLADAMAAFKEIEKGRGSYGDVMKAVIKAPVNKIAGGLTPIIKTPLEIAMGKSLFPDVTNPRPINDRGRAIAQTISAENEYDALTDTPTRGYWKSWLQAIDYSRNVGEIAFNNTQDLVREFKESKGIEGEGSSSTPKSRLIREYKLAQRYGDESAAENALAKMKAEGITQDDIEKSLLRASPLAGISGKDRAEFMSRLTPKEQDQVKSAEAWYKDTILSDDDLTLKYDFNQMRSGYNLLHKQEKELNKAGQYQEARKLKMDNDLYRKGNLISNVERIQTQRKKVVDSRLPEDDKARRLANFDQRIKEAMDRAVAVVGK